MRLEASPPMDLWIMGLLYALIVGGSGDAWDIERKGIRPISVSHRWNVWQESNGGQTRLEVVGTEDRGEIGGARKVMADANHRRRPVGVPASRQTGESWTMDFVLVRFFLLFFNVLF